MEAENGRDGPVAHHTPARLSGRSEHTPLRAERQRCTPCAERSTELGQELGIPGSNGVCVFSY